jgi:hypothetical protein
VDWEALGWSLACAAWLTALFALPPLLAYVFLGWPAAIAAAIAVGAAVALLAKGKWRWGEFAGYTGIAALFGGLSVSVYQQLLELGRAPPPAALLAALAAPLAAPLLYFLAVAYWYAVGLLPPVYWGEGE